MKLKNIKFRANYLLKYNYKNYIHVNYNIALIENIMSNERCHLVAIFKDHLIYDDIYEYLHRFYKSLEIKSRLKKICYYHFETSAIFPNYFPLIESKYLYRSVVQKQRIINEQQDIEDYKEMKNRINKKENNEYKNKLFTSTIYDEILDGSESVMRIVFGLDKNKYNLKKYVNNKSNIESNLKGDNEEDTLYENKDSLELNTLINEIDKAEKNKNPNNKSKNKMEFNLNNKNKNSKPKLKLIANELNNNKIKSKNDLLNSITNNSTNITNSSNNIKTNINLTIKPNNKNFDNIFNVNKKLKLNDNIMNIIKNNKEKINNIYVKEIKILEKKKIVPTPYRTLYGLNFILKNRLINNLIKTDLNIKKHNNIKLNDEKYNYYLNNKNPQTNSIKKFNSIAKERKIPKIDISKLDTKNINNNNILTISNRPKSRNFNEIFKSVSKTTSKSYRKRNKNFFNSKINIVLSLSPFNKKQKNIFRKENEMRLLYTINNKSNKALSINKKNKNYFSNKKMKIDDYLYKKNNYLNINLNNKENKEQNINKALKTNIG